MADAANLIDQLRSTLGKMEIALGAVAEAIVFTDHQGRLQWCNHAFDALAGRSHVEILGEKVHELLPLRQDDLPVPDRAHPINASLRLRAETTGIYQFATSSQVRLLEVDAVAIQLGDGQKSSVMTIRDVTERRKSEEEIRRQARQLAQAQTLAELGSWQWEIGSDTVSWSNELYDIFGLRPQEFEATFEAYLNLVHRDDRPFARELVTAAARDLRPFAFEQRIIRPDGTIRSLQTRGEVIADENGKARTMIGVCLDITERKNAEEELRELSAALESAVEGIAHADADGRYTSVNAAYARALSYKPAELIGRRWLTVVHADDQDGARLAVKGLAAGERVEAEWKAVRKNGQEIHVRMVLVPSRGASGELNGHYCFMQDISSRKFAEEMIRHMAFQDPLTGLANRRLLHDRLTIAMAQSRRSGDPIAILSIDLDRFKAINDTLGHAAGDYVLRTLARQLARTIRDGDTVARIGGDEFLLILPGAARRDASAIASRILEDTETPITYDGHRIQLALSLGIAVWPDDGDEPNELIKAADTEMYRAKRLAQDASSIIA
jgi:diguanylate cyclase (GGDEF)-like protein/PAS domain S-box-containing protein